VAWASGSEDFQNRGRDRRTYQLDRSSTNVARRLAAVSASKSSRAVVTPAMVSSSWSSTQRSSAWLGRGVPSVVDDQPSRSAYVAKKE
jgi:hypothetical protein